MFFTRRNFQSNLTHSSNIKKNKGKSKATMPMESSQQSHKSKCDCSWSWFFFFFDKVLHLVRSKVSRVKIPRVVSDVQRTWQLLLNVIVTSLDVVCYTGLIVIMAKTIEYPVHLPFMSCNN